MRLTFIVAPGRLLVIAPSAVENMKANIQQTIDAPEAGGILLGRHLLESEDMVVDEVTVPQPSDRRSRFTFFRSKRHSELAYRAWEVAKGRTAYLGTWHTHPELDPTPSRADHSDWEKAVSKDSFEGDQLFFPIVGIERIRVWTKSRTGPIQELKEWT